MLSRESRARTRGAGGVSVFCVCFVFSLSYSCLCYPHLCSPRDMSNWLFSNRIFSCDSKSLIVSVYPNISAKYGTRFRTVTRTESDRSADLNPRTGTISGRPRSCRCTVLNLVLRARSCNSGVTAIKNIRIDKI